MNLKRSYLLLAASLVLFTACTPPKLDSHRYDAFRAADPRSILIVPVVNHTVDVTAADYFLSTITRPVVNRGYYVYPVYLVKRILEDDGLADADLVHQADPKRLGTLFGADAILYVTIDRWDAKYAVFATTVEVEFRYALKSGKSGETLWASQETMRYSPESRSTGNPLADLIGMAVTAGIAKAAPDYIPLAQQANGNAVGRLHRGLPAGPYGNAYKQDLGEF